MYSNVLLDLSFTLLRYAGSSLDDDVRFMCRNLDQRLCLGSDFPEYTPAEVLARFDELLPDLPAPKRDAILIRNLEQFLK
jgi:hypothetical protein